MDRYTPTAGRFGSPAHGPESAAGAVTLFDVPFATAMGDHDLAVLAGALALTTNPESPAARPGSNRGFTRLDHSSGLFLTRSADEGRWLLQARTWGHPAAQTVHGWHVLTAEAARQLDPTVSLPPRLPDDAPAVPDRPVGRAANQRLARFRRRLVGLS